MSLKSQKALARYLQRFGNGTQKPEGGGASEAPHVKIGLRLWESDPKLELPMKQGL